MNNQVYCNLENVAVNLTLQRYHRSIKHSRYYKEQFSTYSAMCLQQDRKEGYILDEDLFSCW